MPYTPRSGAFRKVKYSINIYKHNEMSAKELEDVLDMARKLKEEEVVNEEYQIGCDDESTSKDKCKRRKSKPDLSDRTKDSRSGTDDTPNEMFFPKPEFSLLPEDIYESLFPDDVTLPQFPVTSCSDSSFGSDSDATGHDSDYDIDSDDEEWLHDKQEFGITPSRLEFIFAKLNKRNTHVAGKAIGALPAAVHADFHHVFPYWKEKRLQHKNMSSSRSNFQHRNSTKRDVKLPTGYIPSDPYVIFPHKVKKTPPLQSPQQNNFNKFEKREEGRLCFNKMVKLQKNLLNLRSWAGDMMEKNLNKRDQIRFNFANNFNLRYNTLISEDENVGQNYEGQAGGSKKRDKSRTSTRTRVNPTFNLVRATRNSSKKMSSNALKEMSTNAVGSLSSSKTLQSRILRKRKWQRITNKRRKTSSIPSFESVFNGNWSKVKKTGKRVGRKRRGRGK